MYRGLMQLKKPPHARGLEWSTIRGRNQGDSAGENKKTPRHTMCVAWMIHAHTTKHTGYHQAHGPHSGTRGAKSTME
jgi:hypothetical protein